eukprot:scaffold92832_cov23-Prasinocladus_malaysianus.AAC.1
MAGRLGFLPATPPGKGYCTPYPASSANSAKTRTNTVVAIYLYRTRTNSLRYGTVRAVRTRSKYSYQAK